MQHSDAIKAVFMECDKEGCVMADAVKVGNEWKVNGGLQPGTESTVKVVTFMLDDTE